MGVVNIWVGTFLFLVLGLQNTEAKKESIMEMLEKRTQYSQVKNRFSDQYETAIDGTFYEVNYKSCDLIWVCNQFNTETSSITSRLPLCKKGLNIFSRSGPTF